jgi:hypothetical protein
VKPINCPRVSAIGGTRLVHDNQARKFQDFRSPAETAVGVNNENNSYQSVSAGSEPGYSNTVNLTEHADEQRCGRWMVPKCIRVLYFVHD